MQTVSTIDWNDTGAVEAARANRDANLAKIETTGINASVEEILAWRQAHIDNEVTWRPSVALLIDHVVGTLLSAIRACRSIALLRPDAERPLVSFPTHETILDGRGFVFGDIVLPVHDVHWNPERPEGVYHDDQLVILLSASGEESDAHHAVLRERLDAWRDAGRTLLLSIDDETTEIGSDMLYAYGASLSVAGDAMNLDDIAMLLGEAGPTKYATGEDLRIMTLSGRQIDIAPISTIDPSTSEGIDLLSRTINADFHSIYSDIANAKDLGRAAMLLPSVKRVVVKASDLKPMHRETAARDASGRPQKVVILDWTPGRDVNAQDVTRAAWSAYILSLRASEQAGINERCHVSPPTLADAAAAHVESIGARSTPHDCVYGSGECYWELSDAKFDASTGTLTLIPLMGS